VLPFPALKDFHANVISIADAGEFLQLISNSSNLESLTIHMSVIPSSQELYTFLTTMHQSNSRNTLTTVELYDTDRSERDASPSHSLEARALIPLLQCPNMEILSIFIHYGHETINNSLMKDMALAWPRLRQIFLPSFYRWFCPNTNLEGLLHLAQHCHALDSVSHAFELSLPTNMVDPGGNGIRYESMTRLHVDFLRITDVPAVAAYLSNVFPNMMLNDLSHYTEADNWYPSEDEEDPYVIESCRRHQECNRLFAKNRE
jgi:hypothetical protein